MTEPDAPAVLHDLAQDRLLRGIRPMLQDIADVEWVLQPKLVPALRAVIELDLSFDLLVRPPHLKAALTLLTRHPDLRAIVDHAGKPDIANGMWQPWADDIRRIARETSAYCKLSGFVTEARPGWKLRRSAALRRSPARMLRRRAGRVGQRLAGHAAQRRLFGLAGCREAIHRIAIRGGALGDFPRQRGPLLSTAAEVILRLLVPSQDGEKGASRS